MTKFAVIFDMDGVLVDSTKYIWRAINQVLNRQNIHVNDDEIKDYLGLSFKDHIAIWKKKYGIEFNVKEFADEVNGIQLELMKKDLTLDRNLLKLLEDLNANSVPMGIGTSSFIDRTNKILKMLNIEKYFSCMATAEEIPEHKPNPHIFLAVAEKLKTHPHSCVVIEDAATGIEAAKRGGMKSIGYLAPFSTKEHFKEADLVVENFSELSYHKIKNLFE